MATRAQKIMSMLEKKGGPISSLPCEEPRDIHSNNEESAPASSTVGIVATDMEIENDYLEQQDIFASRCSPDLHANMQFVNTIQEEADSLELTFDAEGILLSASIPLPDDVVVHQDSTILCDSEDEFGATESEDNVCVTSNSEQAVGSVLEDSGFNYSNAGDDSKSQDLHIEQSNSDPGVENNTSMNSDYGDMSEGRKRKHKADPNKWKKIKNQNLRMEGKQYLGYTKPKNKKIKQNQIRAARSLKPGCTSERCMRSKKRMCAKFTEDDRLSIFSIFWSDLNWDQRKIVNTKRKTASDESRRAETLIYTLTLNNIKYPVCKIMFLNTLALRSLTVQSWTRKGKHAMYTHKQAESAKRTKKSPYTEDIDFLKNFLSRLPKLPSHYNRANSSKLYLEPIFRSLKQIYDLYIEICKEDGKKYLSNKTFYNQFNETNLALYQPKKDQCDTCVSYKVGNITDEQYKEHILKKNRARSEKETDKKLAEEGKCVVLTMDLQAVSRKPNEPTVTDIRALSYNVEGYIDYKLNFDEDWKQLPSRHKASNEVPIYPPLNKSKLPIKKSKFDHLQALKTVLPEDCQNFYDFLTYKND
nr:unnamed protein product [Callosobruchus analis]